jgi:hypothetical protein
VPHVSDPRTYTTLARAALLARLPRAAADALAMVRSLEEPEIVALRERIYPFDERGIGGARGVQPEGYWYKLAGRRTSALEHAKTRLLAGDARPARLIAWVGFREPESTTPVAIRTVWLGFEVAWSFAIEELPTMYPAFDSRLAIVSEDWRYGFVLDTYVGTLPWEWDEGETVYRIARWRPME